MLSSRLTRAFPMMFAFAVLAIGSAWAQGGTIVGTVHLTGTPPANPIIRMGADPNCQDSAHDDWTPLLYAASVDFGDSAIPHSDVSSAAGGAFPVHQRAA